MKNYPFPKRVGFAVSGVRAAWRSEASFRTHVMAAVGVILVLVWLRPVPIWWAIIGFTTGSVLAAELFNTALERIVDHLHPEHHAMVKLAKDCAAGGVLVLSLAAAAVFAAFLADLKIY